ncbi:MAG TPA: ankyrin repeat domain-containing protein [Patescibacteria group bacterium]|nr:ankyrin repeat domain-containing protein [Patescibacteria group bacterium]
MRAFDPGLRPPSPEEIEGFCTAAQRGDIDFLRDMLDKFGAGIVNARDNINARPLTWAAYSGHTEAVELLLQRGAEIDAGGTNDKPALSWAIECGRSETAAVLLARGASLDVKDNEGLTPADYAARSEDPAMQAMVDDHRRAAQDHERLHGERAREEAARAASASRIEQLKKTGPGKFRLPGSPKR